MIAGASLNWLYFGAAGLVTSLLGLLAAAAVLIGPFALGGVGAGDVKMMGAVGALLGPGLALRGMIVGMALGGLIMVVHLAYRGRLWEKLTALHVMLASAARARSSAPLRVSPDDPAAVTLPYSIPLGAGAIVALLCVGA